MIKWVKDHFFYVVFFMAAIILFAFPLFLNWLAQILKQSGFIVVGDTASWIGFYGSYIGSIAGGILTLVGVIITISFTRKQMKDEKRLTILPYLKPVVKELPFDYKFDLRDGFYLFANPVFGDPSSKIKLSIEIENIGLGTAKDVELTHIGKTENSICLLYALKKEEKTNFYCEIDEDGLEYDDENDEYTMKFQYYDLLNNKYQQDAIVRINLYKDNNSTEKYIFVHLVNYFEPKLTN